MKNQSLSSVLSSELLEFLAKHSKSNDGRIPPLIELSKEFGMSVATLREQLEVARVFGFVEVKPKIGIRSLPYSFAPAVRQSLAYSVASIPESFQMFSDLRNHIETSYWFQAVTLLTPNDLKLLSALVDQAFNKLNSEIVQIPHEEHRKLHLVIYSRLENPFVTGILEAYWDLYEIVGLDLYADITYLKQVWESHQSMVELIIKKDVELGYTILVQHIDLLYKRPAR